MACDGFGEAEGKAGTPLTSVVAKDMVDWLDASKSKLKPLEDDVKDARGESLRPRGQRSERLSQCRMPPKPKHPMEGAQHRSSLGFVFPKQRVIKKGVFQPLLANCKRKAELTEGRFFFKP